MIALVACGSALVVLGLALAWWGYRPPKRVAPKRVRSVSVMTILARCALEAQQSGYRPVLVGGVPVGVRS
ncbi:hypothetical protein [Actinoalloteichus hymeniacidonis]|uniref:Uncharacterized protein n=1 Tax=Actinoalloteichus hymeniacidonis TaxID=340345 RepID=A0AAC9HLL8_9PSEU|nr:hypothetical protein [Actinoalloteichus hymeniacidonis]AOS61552.1 hypothetical protein TL08_03600 [Actinoalloteichus hymeniacidonis]MBB5910440.1 hypothetical protein [Actinoalloteichus hymeniacidonis]